jgi:hypothetical protein
VPAWVRQPGTDAAGSVVVGADLQQRAQSGRRLHRDGKPPGAHVRVLACTAGGGAPAPHLGTCAARHLLHCGLVVVLALVSEIGVCRGRMQPGKLSTVLM